MKEPKKRKPRKKASFYTLKSISPDKVGLVKEILKYQPELLDLGVDLGSYPIELLEHHLKKIKEKLAKDDI